MAKGNKTIMALQGASDTGKTTTLGLLINKYIKLQEKTKEVEVKETTGFRGDDCRAVVSYKKKTICIFTGGDNESYLKKQLAELEEHNPDLYVCACRTRGQTVRFLEEASKTLFLVGKWYVCDELECLDSTFMEKLQNYTNKQQADDLIELIDKILFGFPD